MTLDDHTTPGPPMTPDDHQERRPSRKIRIGRGLFRLWALAAVLWAIFVVIDAVRLANWTDATMVVFMIVVMATIPSLVVLGFGWLVLRVVRWIVRGFWQ
jgi:hypothetical protein